MSTLDVKIIENEDKYDGVYRQEVEIEGKDVFSVVNLSECPEDAIIGRDLFDAFDYLMAVEYGIKLASEGVTELARIIIKE